MSTLPEEVRPVLSNGMPCGIFTCAMSGAPNATYISEVHYVDDSHVALSHQFFSKTKRNIAENPRAQVWLPDVVGSSHWILDLEFERSEEEGPLFDQMEEHLAMIASMSGMEEVFRLKAADVYRVIRCTRIGHD